MCDLKRIYFHLQRQSVQLYWCVSWLYYNFIDVFPERKISSDIWQTGFLKKCCITALLSCYKYVCIVIWFVVLTMHKSKLWLAYLKELVNFQYFLRFSYENFFWSKMSAAMTFGSEALSSQLLVQKYFSRIMPGIGHHKAARWRINRLKSKVS